MNAFPLIVFDVNETLLDLTTLEPTFERIFGDKGAMRLWFANFILYSSARTVAGCYVPFTDIGSAVMKMLAGTREIRIDDADNKELVEKFSTMPPHPEVPAALQKLREAGFRLFTLTDNLPEVQTRQLEHAGIVGFFERRFSADGVKHHKPSRQAYAHVERNLGVEPSQLLPYRLLYMGHPWRRRCGLGGCPDQAVWQRRPGSRTATADRRCRLGRRRRSVDRAAQGVNQCRVRM
jgi:2-haloacid dehalogenase